MLPEPFYQEEMATIFNGNALEVLRSSLPNESVQMAMCSPPYWGLRNYAGGADLVWGGDENCEHEWGNEKEVSRHSKIWASSSPMKNRPPEKQVPVSQGNFCLVCGAWRGQLGLEPTPELYVEHLMMIFQELKRVLRKDGSFYLNIGDTYTSGKGSCYNPGGGNKSWQSWIDKRANYPAGRAAPNRMYKGIPPKCMTCIPERVMFAMLENGWILRNKIVWQKPNHMPGSQKDRFTCSWEYLFFFTKSGKYYFDLDAVRQPHTTLSLERYQRGVNLGRPAIGKSAEVGPMQEYTRAPQWFKDMFPPDTDYKGKFNDLFGHGPNPQSFNLRVRDVKRGKKGSFVQDGEVKQLAASEQEVESYDYPEKHHGAPMNNRERLHRGRGNPEGHKYSNESRSETKQGFNNLNMKGHSGYYDKNGNPLVDFAKGKNPGDVWEITTQPSSICVCPKCDAVFPRKVKVCPHCGAEGVVGHFAPYPERLCEMPIKASSRVGDTVLDMFMGAGTTLVSAKKLGRRAIGIDCVREYAVMAAYRLRNTTYQPAMISDV